MTSAVPVATLEALRTGLRFDPAYVAQHSGDFVLSYDGSESIRTEKCDKLRIKNIEGKEMVWSIDQTGRIRRGRGKGKMGGGGTDISGYRLIHGLKNSFKRPKRKKGVEGERGNIGGGGII